MNTIALRKNTIPRISRKSAKTITKTVNTLFGEETLYLMKSCTKCGCTHSVHNFYVKKYKQHIREEDLSVDDFRDICIPCHDAEASSNKKYSRQFKKKFVAAIMASNDPYAILRNKHKSIELMEDIYQEMEKDRG